MRNRNTIEYLGIWEKIHNPNFNYGEFAVIKSQAGLNSYKLSVKEWSEKTNAIGLMAKAGRYGGTYAHKDIAFEFGMWISIIHLITLLEQYAIIIKRIFMSELQYMSLHVGYFKKSMKISNFSILQSFLSYTIFNIPFPPLYNVPKRGSSYE